MDMEQLASIFEAVKVMPLRKNDVIVFRTPHFVPVETAKRFKEMLGPQFEGHRVIVLDGGADLEIIRREDLQEAA